MKKLLDKSNRGILALWLVVLFGLGLIRLSHAASGTIWTLTGMGARRNTVEITLEEPTVGTPAALNPGVTAVVDLGTESLDYRNVFVSSVVVNNFYVTEPNTHQVDADTTHTPAGSYITLTSSGGPGSAFNWDATPVFSTTTLRVGTHLYVVNKASQSIVISDEGTVAASGLSLGATTRSLGQNDSIHLILEDKDSRVWVELSFANNQ